MKKTHNYTCIVCPVSCELELIEDEGHVIEIKGSTCKRGTEYAKNEFTNPVRTFTTTMHIKDGELSLVPVHSAAEIPKSKIKECVKELAKITVQAPVNCGEIVCKDVCGTGVSVVASRDIQKKRK